MSFFIASVITSFKRLLTPSGLIPIAVLAIALVIGNYVQKELALQVGIGVYFESESEISKEIISNLESLSNIHVRRYYDKTQMLDDIAAVKIECGYAFDNELARYMENGSINRAAKLYKSDATIGDGFTNELVFAALTKTAAPYISANYLNGKTDMPYADVLNEARGVIDSYYENGVFLDINVSSVGERSETSTKNRINTGIVSVFLFISFFYITISGVCEKKSGVYEKLTYRNGILFTVSNVVAYALLLFTAASVLYAPSNGIAHSLLVLGVYIASLAAISSIAVILIKSAYPLYALFPVICTAVVTLGGAFFDISEISPALGKISYIFPTYYFCIYM